MGEIEHFSGRSCAFISGTIQVEQGVFLDAVPELNDAAWYQIRKEIRMFFPDEEILGWVLDLPGNMLEVSEDMEAIHRNNFPGPFQFFFLMDSKEREEAFYMWKQGCLARKEGYFIYYENAGIYDSEKRRTRTQTISDGAGQ